MAALLVYMNHRKKSQGNIQKPISDGKGEGLRFISKNAQQLVWQDIFDRQYDALFAPSALTEQGESNRYLNKGTIEIGKDVCAGREVRLTGSDGKLVIIKQVKVHPSQVPSNADCAYQALKNGLILLKRDLSRSVRQKLNDEEYSSSMIGPWRQEILRLRQEINGVVNKSSEMRSKEEIRQLELWQAMTGASKPEEILNPFRDFAKQQQADEGLWLDSWAICYLVDNDTYNFSKIHVAIVNPFELFADSEVLKSNDIASGEIKKAHALQNKDEGLFIVGALLQQNVHWFTLVFRTTPDGKEYIIADSDHNWVHLFDINVEKIIEFMEGTEVARQFKEGRNDLINSLAPLLKEFENLSVKNKDLFSAQDIERLGVLNEFFYKVLLYTWVHAQPAIENEETSFYVQNKELYWRVGAKLASVVPVK